MSRSNLPSTTAGLMQSPFPMPAASGLNPTSCTASAAALSSWDSAMLLEGSINSYYQPVVDISRPLYSPVRWGVPYSNGEWPRMDLQETQPATRGGCNLPSRGCTVVRTSMVDEARVEPPPGSTTFACGPPRSEPSLISSKEYCPGSQ